MGFTLITIPIGIIALFLSLFSINIAGWFVWIVYVIISIIFFVESHIQYKEMIKGEPKSITDMMGMASFPFTTSIMGIVLIIFLFLDVNKLHLLWIYPIVAIFFDLTIGKRAGKKISPKSFEKIEKLFPK